MVIKLSKEGRLNTISVILFTCITLSFLIIFVNALPTGPTITVLSNETKVEPTGSIINSTINETISPGGFIFTLGLTSIQQNKRWKGYVGNVSGTLVLDDASDNTLFQWSLSVVTGEVYATRAETSVNWSGINCTWIANWGDDIWWNHSNASSVTNRTAENDENAALSHTSRDDNITATFVNTNHTAITVGGVVIGKDECFSLQTWQRDAAQTFSDSTLANFTEVILYDGAFNKTGGNIIYETKIENDLVGFDSSETYDFQMILPENGGVGFSSSTAYYFYVELS